MADVHDPVELEPWSDVLADHERRLPDQVEYLAEHSAFYGRRFEEWGVEPGDVRSLADLRELPFTTKDDERAAQDDAPPDRPLGEHQAAPTAALNRVISSSGTTGRPTYFGLTERDRRDWNTVLQRCFHTAGIRPDDTVLFGPTQTMITGGTPYFEGLTALGANVVPAGGGSTERLLSVGLDLHADVLFSTTSHVRYLAERVEAVAGVTPAEFPTDKVVGGAAPGIANPEIRRELYDAWDATLVREIMGLGDVIGCLWAECEAEAGMHYHGQGHAHVELIDPQTGEAIGFEDGAEGELVYTHLRREATPLLRFRSGDVARVVGTDCGCGRTSPRIQCIGRTDEMLIYKGMNVYPSAVRDVVAGLDGLAPRLRVVVPPGVVNFETPIPIEVALEPGADREAAEAVEAVREAVRERLQVQVDPTVVAAEELGPGEYKTALVEEREPDA
ncbi:MAG: hypothetical protein U5J98_09625 [Halobacteriales archaeon]|nr:hypothetical protein [Halobacteriales archaeon]